MWSIFQLANSFTLSIGREFSNKIFVVLFFSFNHDGTFNDFPFRNFNGSINREQRLFPMGLFTSWYGAKWNVIVKLYVKWANKYIELTLFAYKNPKFEENLSSMEFYRSSSTILKMSKSKHHKILWTLPFQTFNFYNILIKINRKR